MSKQRIRKRVLEWLKIDMMLEDLFFTRKRQNLVSDKVDSIEDSVETLRAESRDAMRLMAAALDNIEAALAIEAQEGAVKRRPADADPHWGTGA